MSFKDILKRTFYIPKREDYIKDKSNNINLDEEKEINGNITDNTIDKVAEKSEDGLRSYVSKNYKSNGICAMNLSDKKDLIADIVMIYRFNKCPCELSNNINFYQQDYVYKYGVNPVYLAKRLVNEKFLTVGLDNSHIIDYLNCLKVNELKEILKYKQLSISGNKKSIIERVKENYSLEELININKLASQYCFVTEKGIKLLNDNLDLIELHNDHDGLEYVDYIKLKKEHSGLNFKEIKNIVRNEKVQKEIDQFISNGYEYYKISTCEDERVCKLCNEMHNKKFKFSDAKIGVNFPPFHDDCRCTFEIVVDDWDKWMDEREQKHRNKTN